MTQFPPKNFVQTQSAVPGIDIYMPKPPEEIHQEVVDFHCPQCDGVSAYSAENGGLTCTFCGFYEPPPQDVVGKQAEAFEFTVETMARVAHGWGTERKELVCDRCAAHTTHSTDMLTHTCPFCGSNQVVQVKAPQDTLRPRFLIPFTVTADECRQKTAVWLQDSWLLPRKLNRLAHKTEYTPIYIPYWTFDATTQAEWKAEVAHTRQKRVQHNGRWTTQTVTEWRWENGRASVDFDDLLINGSQHLSQQLLHQIQNYDVQALVPYDATFLAGIQAQAYDVDLDAAWERGRHTMRAKTKEACKAQASSRKMRNFSMDLAFNDENWRYILMPLYLATYHYGNETYQVLINGQTGQLAGQRPADWKKVLLAVGGMLLPAIVFGLLAFIIANVPVVDSGYVPLIGLLAVFAFVVGLFAAIRTVTQAAHMDDV
jgi:Zn finger protein HypA/HybF involved in hydrogenase expression